MKCPTQLNCQGIVSSKEPKTLRGSGQNRQRSRLFYPTFPVQRHDHRPLPGRPVVEPIYVPWA